MPLLENLCPHKADQKPKPAQRKPGGFFFVSTLLPQPLKDPDRTQLGIWMTLPVRAQNLAAGAPFDRASDPAANPGADPGADPFAEGGDGAPEDEGGYTICINVAANGRMTVHSEPAAPQGSPPPAPQGTALADQPGAAGLAAALAAGAQGGAGVQGGAGAQGDAGADAPAGMPVKDFKAAILAAYDIYKSNGAMPEASDADMQSEFQAGYQGAAL